MAPLAAFTMACVLFAYTRHSIQSAKVNAIDCPFAWLTVFLESVENQSPPFFFFLLPPILFSSSHPISPLSLLSFWSSFLFFPFPSFCSNFLLKKPQSLTTLISENQPGCSVPAATAATTGKC
ncbi:hypothetical protein B0H63DRAFT_477823 [Podospora didyma]|uniref:Secreted protein n=1 Tax=Podospora didyma TaxID=330526 RepID=A0AAE0KK34_9PEZI|nr:hypothetical protein B0H63DRAFT_477823 [Podospora didyma]